MRANVLHLDETFKLVKTAVACSKVISILYKGYATKYEPRECVSCSLSHNKY